MTPISRRMFLVASAGVLVAACSSEDGSTVSSTSPPTEPTSTQPDPTTTPEAPTSAATEPPTTLAATTTTEAAIELSGEPFTLGVASGDPDSTSVVLWTRLAPDPLNGGGMPDVDLDVTWEMSSSAEFDDIISTGVATAESKHGHSVHAIAGPGQLFGAAPSSEALYFRFRYGQYTSPVGRTMLAPDGPTDQARFVSASCQNFQNGFYAAHRDIAEQKPDFVIWLGDYIYESGGATVGVNGAVRSHVTPEPTDRVAYRNRYALYKSDVNLQAAHHACPWFVVWDDHEVENNYASETPQDPADAAGFVARRQAAYMAWWEHQPVRLAPPPDAGEFRIYRDLAWGDLLGLTLLDTRQYRTDQACGDVTFNLDPPCPETFDDGRTLTGVVQETWMYDTINSHNSIWNVIGQQVVMTNLTLDGAVLNYDQWDGYPKSHDRLLQHLADMAVPNAIVLSGDIHLAGVGVLRTGAPGVGQAVAVEFVDTSISSGGLVDPALTDLVKSFPDIVDVELAHRGYTMHTVTPSSWLADYRIVESVADPNSLVTSYKTFAVDAGTSAVRVVQ